MGVLLLGLMAVSLLPGICFILFISLMVIASGPSTYVVFMLCNLSALWESCLPGESYLPSGLAQDSPSTSGVLTLCWCVCLLWRSKWH